MAFQGYYLKFDNIQLPNQFCCNYKVAPDRRTDKNSFVNGDGKLNRTILPHKRSGITFNTGFITDSDITTLSSIFNGRDNVSVVYWNPIKQNYSSGSFYIPDMEFETLMDDGTEVTYRPVELELIEY